MANVAERGMRLQLGMESTQYTPVAATKRMRSFGIDLDPQLETDQFTPDGNWVPSSSSLIQEWTEGDIDGVLTYTEIVYLLSMAFGDPTSAVAASVIGANTGVLSRDWLWTLTAQQIFAPRAATVERGSSVYGSRVPGAVVNNLGFEWSRTDRIELSGSILGGQLEKGFSPTVIGANPTVDLVRVLPTQLDMFVDDTFAAISGAAPTKILKSFSGGLSLDDLFGPVWAINSSKPSLDSIVPLVPETENTLLLMADAVGLQFLDQTRAGQVKYLKIRATGPVIETVTVPFPYLFEITLPVEVKDVDAFEGNEGVYAIPWTFQPVDDGTNPPLTVKVRNKLSAL